MAKYPEASSIPWDNPESHTLMFRTLTSSYGQSGEEQSKQKWLYPKREVGPLQYTNIDKADAETLWQFYLDRKGAYEVFNFFDANSDNYEGEYVGTGDGSTTVFNLPGKSTSSRTVKIDGVSQTEGVDYTFSALGGTDGADEITFGSAPNEGEYITIDFTGILKVQCQFKEDKLKYETFYNILTIIGIELKGRLNA